MTKKQKIKFFEEARKKFREKLDERIELFKNLKSFSAKFKRAFLLWFRRDYWEAPLGDEVLLIRKEKKSK